MSVATIVPIIPSTHSDKSWIKVPDYRFALEEISCPIGLQEIVRCAFDVPTGFIKSDSGYSLIGILGLHKNRNLFVGNSGRWHGRYIPAVFRAYPFLLAKNESDENQLVFCIDQESGLVTDNRNNIPFFSEEGELSSELKQVFKFLEELNAHTLAADRMCKIFEKHKLLKPWEIGFEVAGKSHRMDGLFCIDEESLNKLPDAEFLALRDHGALLIAHCQLLSMQHITELAQRMQLLSQSEEPAISDELKFSSLDSDGTISFDNL